MRVGLDASRAFFVLNDPFLAIFSFNSMDINIHLPAETQIKGDN
jgi:hypothetical protein